MAYDIGALNEAYKYIYEDLKSRNIEARLEFNYTSYGDILVHIHGLTQSDRSELYKLFGECGKDDEHGVFRFLRDF